MIKLHFFLNHFLKAIYPTKQKRISFQSGFVVLICFFRDGFKTQNNNGLDILPKIMQIAACLILVAAIGTTVAIAKDASFRSAVMQLLIHIDQEEGVANISFEENSEKSFEVPADWLGEYYPSQIPSDFTVSYMFSDSEAAAVEFKSTDGREIGFDEYSYKVVSSQGIEEADTSEIMINDRLALMVSDDNPDDLFYRITWSNDERWFMLTTVHMTKEETIELVKSVRKIIPKDK